MGEAGGATLITLATTPRRAPGPGEAGGDDVEGGEAGSAGVRECSLPDPLDGAIHFFRAAQAHSTSAASPPKHGKTP